MNTKQSSGLIRPVALLTSLSLGMLSVTGCVKQRMPMAYADSPTVMSAPCSSELMEIQHATYGEQARVSVRVYLNCILDSEERPPTDLDLRVADQLKRNPYPATARDRDSVVGQFFDKDRLKDLPGSIPEMHSYVQLLEDQALAAKAQGDTKLAQAAEARAAKIEKIIPILDDIQG